jgi:hypothetical protein
MSAPLPTYEWRYIPNPEWVEGPKKHPFGLNSFIALVLVTAREDFIVQQYANPWPGVPLSEQPPLSLDRLNGLLHASVSRAGGMIEAAAAQTIFLQHVLQLTAASTAVPFSKESPRGLGPTVHSILKPSMGWLVWTWQMEALCRSAGCLNPLARQLTTCWKQNYPSILTIMNTMSIDRHALGDVFDLTTAWGMRVTHMTMSPALIDAFKESPRD